jgi:diaminopimelate decarboxylase
MSSFHYRGGELHCEDIPLSSIAEQYGTPAYVYSQRAIVEAFDRIERAYADVPHLICYALKANSNIAICHLLASRGAGMDTVSAGEIYRALKAGTPPERIVFAGVGKTREEIAYALEVGILQFTVESAAELELIDQVAGVSGQSASIAFRVNPDVDPQTHPYISTGLKKNKFGVPRDDVLDLYQRAAELPNVLPQGIQVHIGSQLVKVQPIVDAVERVVALVDELRQRGIALRYIDIGGGLAIRYREEDPEGPDVVAEAIKPLIKATGCTLLMEPGRFLVGNAGVLLTRVVYVKQGAAKKFVIVDAAMNDLLRPSLYDAYHEIRSTRETTGEEVVDVVGPVCESGDFFAHDRTLPIFQSDDLMSIMSAGAYGFAMASNYNSRPRPAEILVDGARARVIRQRETLEDLVRGEVT